MNWKMIFAAAAVTLAACNEGAHGPKGAPEAAAPGYTLDVFARNNEQIYLISHDGGRVAAARVVDKHSEIIQPAEAHQILDARQAEFRAPEHQAVNVQAGGFSLSISGDGDDKTGDAKNGSAHIELNSGGHGVSIDAQGNDADGRARVHVTGADEQSARSFINDADDLSPEVKTEMLHTLGL
ncbi:MAG TPA: hypothetical protein VG943_11450 [Caulobacterales bacterium]|nr:hypothetical protein [Caulobacterales bacterium]